MIVQQKRILEILSALNPGISKQGYIEQTDHYIFNYNYIMSYNDSLCVIYPFKCGFQCSVPANELYHVISHLKDVEIDISYDEDQKLLFIFNDSFKIQLNTETGLSLINIINEFNFKNIYEKAVNLPKNFTEAVNLCQLSTQSRNVHQPYLQAIYLNNK